MGLLDKAKGAAQAGMEKASEARSARQEAATEAAAAADVKKAQDAADQAEAVATGAAPLLSLKSHDEGRNADVSIYPDRIVRVVERSRLALTKAKQDSEVIPVKSISSVQAKKDGLVYTKVTLFATGNTIEFRLRHEDAQNMRQTITELILQRDRPAAAASTPAPTLGGGIAEELRKLAELRDAGVLSEDEFAAQKAKLLA